MEHHIKNNVPWLMFLPLLVVIGLVSAVWGGILVQQQVKESHIQHLMLQSEKQMAQLGRNWMRLNGKVQALRMASTASDPASASGSAFPAQRHRHMAEQLMAEMSGVTGLMFVERRYANKLDVQATFGDVKARMPQNIETVLASFMAAGKLDNNLKILPVSPSKSSSQGVQSLWVAAMMLPQAPQIILAKVDVAKLMRAKDLRFQPMININFPEKQSMPALLPSNKQGHATPDYKSNVTLGGVRWQFEWDYNGAQGSKRSYVWGGIFTGFVLVVTGFVLWLLWSQYLTAQRVRQEVVARTKELEQTSRRFRLITDNAYDLIAIVSVSGSVEYVNSAYNRVLGYARKALYGQSLAAFVYEEDQPYFQEAVQAVVDGRPVSEVNFRFQTRQNTWVYMEAIAKGIFDSNWNLRSIVLHSRNVTSRKRYADELARSEQRFKDFADSSADWLWEVDNHYNFVYVSPGVKGTLGYMPKEMLSQPMFDVLFTSKDDVTRELIENLAKRHQSFREVEFWTRTNTGERVCLRLSALPIFDVNGEFAGYRGAATNITASKVDSENMLRLATTDHLTGLLNRSKFMEELDHSMTLARRHNTNGVVLFLDMDRFKAVNDTHGHSAGDEVIKSVASILQKSMRSTDVIARLAGDEFAVIMHNIDGVTAYDKVEKLIERINTMQVAYQGARLQVTMSVGMVKYPQVNKDASQLLTSADLAMYRAKDMGRNQIYMDEQTQSSDEASATVRVQLEWIDRLRDALQNDKFEMHYQPIVPISEDTPVIYEALIRLRDEDGNLGAPALFIDAAEHFGMIRDLDRAVVERCIQTQSQMAQNGQSPVLSLNLSGMSFGDDQLLKNMKIYFEKYQADPQNFIFEVTETAAMRDIEQARAFVKELKNMGCGFSLDDFGVGFSSFFYIKHLDVDYIKIDGSYIKNLDTSKEDRLFVKSLVDLATGLGIKTVAEFVENKPILDELETMNVGYTQGYYLSKPGEDLNYLYDSFDGQTARQKSDFIEKTNNKANNKSGAVKPKAKTKTKAKAKGKATNTGKTKKSSGA